MPPLNGRVIAGRYHLQSPIGRGAMGVVWRAHDNLLDREVAVKEVVISALIGADERYRAYQRTLREARTAARLSHRGVVAIYDVVEEDGRPWIIMELVPSQSLDQLLVVEGRLPPSRACRIGQQLLSALTAAHGAGVLHRDVKPSNVLISTSRTGEGWDERAVLTDFGIAQFEGDPRLTQTGMVMGSPGFTAPERIRGSDATPASDLWSLGATIYAAVEGRGPYDNRGGPITTMSAIINEDAPLAPHAGSLAPVIAALLRRDPLARPSAALAARMFAQALPKLSENRDEPPAPPHPPTVRSAYVPPPAAPVASAQVTTPNSARQTQKQAPAPREEPSGEAAAARSPAAEEQAEHAPSAGETPDAVDAGKAGQADAASAAEPEPEAEAASAPAAAEAVKPVEQAKPGEEATPGEEPGEEAKPAVAEAAELKASAPEPVAEPPADAPAAESKAAAFVAPAADGDDSGSLAADTVIPSKAGDTVIVLKGEDTVIPGKAAKAADTVIPLKGQDTVISRKEAAGYDPTEFAIPAARIAPPASAPAPAKPPTTAKPGPAKPEPPKPTFTAAKPTDRVAPSFSAASPPRPATPVRPTPPRAGTPGIPSSQRPAAYGQGGQADQGGPSGSAGKSGTTPFPPSDSTYRAPGAQPAGAAQPALGLPSQYLSGPGSGGGHAKDGQRRAIIWALAAVALAAAIGIGTALALNHGSTGGTGTGGTDAQPSTVPSVQDTTTAFQSVNALNDPSTALPGTGWQAKTVTKADAQSAAAGFSIDVPPGWTEARKGLATDFTGPGDLLLDVDLTQQSTSDMLTAVTQVRNASVPKTFPQYKQLNLQAEPVRHAEGAVWKFTSTPAGGVQVTADDIFFAQATSAGVQDYAIYIRSPSSTFGTTSLALFDKMLRTFQVVPAS